MPRRAGYRPRRIGSNPVAVKSFELRGERPGRLADEPTLEPPLLPSRVVLAAPRLGGFAVAPVDRRPEYEAGLA